jgi:hypothetical protein
MPLHNLVGRASGRPGGPDGAAGARPYAFRGSGVVGTASAIMRTKSPR